MRIEKLRGNIWKLYTIQALRWFLLSVPILVPFYQSNGLSIQQVLIVQASFGVTLALLEIPTGFIADMFGRKRAIVLGMIVWPLAWGFYSVSHSFEAFLLAEGMLALGTALLSGADSALLFDTLTELEESGTYTKREGIMNTTWNVSEGVASVLGGLLAVVSLRFPMYIQAVVAALAIPVALSLIEPTRKKMNETTGKVRLLLQTLRFALIEHSEIKWLTIYTASVSCAGITFLWFIQPRLAVAGVPLAWFGVVWAALQFSSGFVSSQAQKIEMILGRKTTLYLLLPVTALSFVLLAYAPGIFAIAVMFIPFLVRGLNIPILRDYVNRRTPSELRATVLSLSGLIMRGMFVIIGPLVGFIHDQYSFSTAFITAGVVFGVISVVSLARMKTLRVL